MISRRCSNVRIRLARFSHGKGTHPLINSSPSTPCPGGLNRGYSKIGAAGGAGCRRPPVGVVSSSANRKIDVFLIHSRLVQLLERNERPELQFEAAWALTNIASGNSEQTECVVRAGSCDHFIRLLSSPAINVAEQAVWALANIAGEGPVLRDMIIDLGVLPSLTRLITPTATPSFLANIAWCISNLCRNKNPPPALHAIQACLPSIKQLLLHDSPGVVSDACWSLSYISDGDNDRIQLVGASIRRE